MRDPASPEPVRLGVSEYVTDFESNQLRSDLSTLKLESAQSFSEPDSASWVLFDSGDWQGAVALARGMSNELQEYFGDLRRRGITTRRVRVVDDKITPYLWWEAQVLRERSHAGELIRVVSLDDASRLLGEKPGELLILGDEILYEILYKEGELVGAIRHTDVEHVSRVSAAVEKLFDEGADFDQWFVETITASPPA